MEEAVKELFSLDKNGSEGYTIQILIWDNTEDVEQGWEDEFILNSADLVDKSDQQVRRVTKRLSRFMRAYKKAPRTGKVEKTNLKK